jgi:hypothetical protein
VPDGSRVCADEIEGETKQKTPNHDGGMTPWRIE